MRACMPANFLHAITKHTMEIRQDTNQVFFEYDEGSEQVLMSNVIGFCSKVTSRLTFEFQDFWENTFQEYTYEYLWCCYAIAWGIHKYDETKQQSTKV